MKETGADLRLLYKSIKGSIDERLGSFAALWESGGSADLFREMCFCACTPQNNAEKAWQAALALDASVLKNSPPAEIAEILKENGVRFHHNKARYIAINREIFYPETKKTLSKIIEGGRIIEARGKLEKKVAGWGLKEASHFLRNTGFGAEICILDRHIMRQLVKYGVIDAVPEALGRGLYLSIEQKMLSFAKKEGLPADALDLLFWYKAKNCIFK